MNIERGDVVLTDLEPVRGSEQGKTRPCLVIQNDIGNANSSTTIVASITSHIERQYPFTVLLNAGEGNLPKDSLIQCNQLRTISKDHRIIKKIGSLSLVKMKEVNEALKTSLALD